MSFSRRARLSGVGCGAGARSGAGQAGLALAVQVAQLALEVRLEPGPVLPLELLELLDVLLQRGPLGVQAAHDLLVALAGVALERLGLGPGVEGELVSLGP